MADERLMNDVMMMEKGHRQGELVGLVSGPHIEEKTHTWGRNCKVYTCMWSLTLNNNKKREWLI